MSRRPQPATLTLFIDGQRITADRFARVVESFSALVKEVAATLTGSSNSIEWIVSLKEGSIGLAYKGDARKPSARPAEVANATYRGLKQVQRSRKRPAHFSDNALQSAKELARLNDGRAISKLKIVRTSREHVLVDEKAAVNVDFIMGGTMEEWGTIEGTLEMISSRSALHFGVWDVIHDRQVRCYFGPDKLDDAMRTFRKRVAVSGPIRYRPTGEAVSIEVEDLQAFPEESELPTLEQTYGILSAQ